MSVVVTDAELIEAVERHGTPSEAARALGTLSERRARERFRQIKLNGESGHLGLLGEKAPPRILVYDIETAPNLAWVWRFFKENISPSQVEQWADLLCWSAKWLGDDTTLFDSRENDEDDERICRALWDLYDQADIVVAHNGNAFDQKTMRARWVQYGMMPPSPYKEVDTLKIARKWFKFPSNKLDAIARYLRIGCKKPHEGFTLWTRCMDGDREAWQIMEEYNIHDVRILERVYLRLRPWDRQHPNVSLYYEDGAIRCLICGSTDVVEIPQDSYTSVSSFPSCRCRNCGKVMRSGTRNKQWKEDIKRHSL